MPEGPLLVVFEDSDSDAMLLQFSLDSHFGDYGFQRVDDGDRADEAIRHCAERPEHRPDIFVIDLNLPKRSGLDILHRIREIPQLRAIPAVVLTSSECPADRKKAEQLGVAAFIKKPITLAEYLAIGADLKILLRSAAAKEAAAS